MKHFISFLPLLILLSVVVFAVWYLSGRFSQFFQVSQRALVFVFTAVILICFFGVFFAMRANATGMGMHIFSNIVAVGLGVLIFLLGCTLVVDVIRLFVKVPGIYYGLTVVGLTLLTSGYALWNAGNTRVVEQKIALPHLQHSLRIMQFSDVHLGYYWGKRTLQKLVDMTVVERVDAVVITGDLFDGRIRLSKETLEPLRELKVPVFFVEGNHDGYTGVREIKQLLTESGVQVLSNQVAKLGELQIIGLDYMKPDEQSQDMMHVRHNGHTMKEVLAKLPLNRNQPIMLLHHNPVGEEYAFGAGVQLYLAGHTHAGQFYPLIWINDRLFKFNRGLYDYKGMKLYVSQGSGSFGPPMRLGTHSEITLWKLDPK